MSNSILTTQLCGITFQGNTHNKLQQDAFFFVENCYQKALGITAVKCCDNAFCVAVADGVSQSPLSGFASKIAVQSVKKLWQDYLDQPSQSPIMAMQTIYQMVATAPRRYYGAMTTLALLYRKINDNQIVIKHIGDSRVYLYRQGQWQCLTKDHNFLNEWLTEQAQQGNEIQDTQQEHASVYHTLTDYLTIDADLDSNPMPKYDSQILSVQSDDCLLVCSDGVYDLVPCGQWQAINKYTDLQAWLKQLRLQIYQSEGKAYDNATAVVIRFNH
ncbi:MULTISPECIES: PP2C family protein-serine/threonine phosphatase [unclassified Acinetobacter]|uniref:PP2C family protein-serine/threonine phosphatase n=1 Tax=unclassified Acinetobacter TaxID=196816 RepID=UPI0035BAD7AB